MASYSNGLLQEPLENRLLGSTGATSCCESVRILIPQTEHSSEKSLLRPMGGHLEVSGAKTRSQRKD